jgi:hypothetical protein
MLLSRLLLLLLLLLSCCPRWRQLSEPADQVVWVDLLTKVCWYYLLAPATMPSPFCDAWPCTFFNATTLSCLTHSVCSSWACHATHM